MIRETFRAMGTSVIAVADSAAGIAATRDLFADIEARCSRFDPASELTWLNDQPPGIVEISRELTEVFRIADAMRATTGGLVDPAVGSSVVEWGYDRSFEQVADRAAAPEPRALPPWSMDESCLHRAEGVLFDLGGIAKGWACDRAVEAGMAVLVSAGGDLRSADPSTIAEVMDPWGALAAQVDVGVGALATSSVTRRRWRAGGSAAHHIIDPRTGTPTDSPVLSATVVAATAAEAEAGAKATLLLGESGLAWADTRRWLRGSIVTWHTGAVFATAGLRSAA